MYQSVRSALSVAASKRKGISILHQYLTDTLSSPKTRTEISTVELYRSLSENEILVEYFAICLHKSSVKNRNGLNPLH